MKGGDWISNTLLELPSGCWGWMIHEFAFGKGLTLFTCCDGWGLASNAWLELRSRFLDWNDHECVSRRAVIAHCASSCFAPAMASSSPLAFLGGRWKDVNLPTIYTVTVHNSTFPTCSVVVEQAGRWKRFFSKVVRLEETERTKNIVWGKNYKLQTKPLGGDRCSTVQWWHSSKRGIGFAWKRITVPQLAARKLCPSFSTLTDIRENARLDAMRIYKDVVGDTIADSVGQDMLLKEFPYPPPGLPTPKVATVCRPPGLTEDLAEDLAEDFAKDLAEDFAEDFAENLAADIRGNRLSSQPDVEDAVEGLFNGNSTDVEVVVL